MFTQIRASITPRQHALAPDRGSTCICSILVRSRNRHKSFAFYVIQGVSRNLYTQMAYFDLWRNWYYNQLAAIYFRTTYTDHRKSITLTKPLFKFEWVGKFLNKPTLIKRYYFHLLQIAICVLVVNLQLDANW